MTVREGRTASKRRAPVTASSIADVPDLGPLFVDALVPHVEHGFAVFGLTRPDLDRRVWRRPLQRPDGELQAHPNRERVWDAELEPLPTSGRAVPSLRRADLHCPDTIGEPLDQPPDLARHLAEIGRGHERLGVGQAEQLPAHGAKVPAQVGLSPERLTPHGDVLEGGGSTTPPHDLGRQVVYVVGQTRGEPRDQVDR